MRVALFFPLLLAAASAAAQNPVLLDFGGPGDHLVFTAQTPPNVAPEGGTLTKEANLELPSAPGNVTLYVWDREAGRIATRPVKGVTAWTVKPADYKDVAEFKILVEPARPARIVLKDGRREVSRLADEGSATFFFLKPGKAEATVEFNQDGKPKTITQIVEISPNGTASIALPATAAATASSPESTKAAGASPGEAKGEASSPVGKIFSYLVGLALVVGGGYAAIRYYQANKGQMDQQLEKLGVQVPKPPDADLTTADPGPAIPKPPEPVQKIVLDDAAPTPLAAAPVAAAVSLPKLGGGIWLAQGSDRIDLPQGETVVGREAGLGLSLMGETSVSRKHATLTRVGDTVTLVDHGSTNGSFVNGAKVTSSTILRAGDEVRFGQATFRFGG
ncbi:FHA domain-containing protein [bacterium]|nr:MAG: FHA domain-containing protein [bacterium]